MSGKGCSAVIGNRRRRPGCQQARTLVACDASFCHSTPLTAAQHNSVFITWVKKLSVIFILSDSFLDKDLHFKVHLWPINLLHNFYEKYFHKIFQYKI
jgi:hypothetical protein